MTEQRLKEIEDSFVISRDGLQSKDIAELISEVRRLRPEDQRLQVKNPHKGYDFSLYLSESYEELAKENQALRERLEERDQLLRESAIYMRSLFSLIEHGDEEHRRWLKEAVESHLGNICNRIAAVVEKK